MRELPSGTVTFLFTDIEGSTRLLKRLGSEYADVLDAHHRLLRAVFTEFGGREVDTQGDALFIAFSRAKDAAAAAVEAQRALVAHPWPGGVDVRVRMGLHTGEPLVGADRYVGIGVHTAARVCSAGHGGQILLSSVTTALVEDELPEQTTLRDLGDHNLKDLDRPERLFQLVVEGLPQEFPPPKAAEPVGAGAFIGRARELAELTSSLEDALSGHGRIVLVAGEPGIGKSRLADELSSQARARGARILVGRCWEAGGAPAFWPWVQALRSYVSDADADALRRELGRGAGDVAQIVPELREILPDVPVPPAADSDGARFRLFDSLASFLRSAAASRPIVIVLDDLHAADTPSLLLLQFVAGELTDSRILVVGCYRDVDPTLSDALGSTLAQLGRQRTTRVVSLVGFAAGDVARFVKASTGLDPNETLVMTIRRETEGNPLFVGELLRLLAAEGRWTEIGDGGPTRLAVPQGVRSVIGRRLRRLSPECTDVLTLASVLGREFTLEALELVAERPREDILEILDEAVAERVVGEVPRVVSQLRFAHALIRDTLYDELPSTRRVRLHARIGKALEQLYADDLDPHLAELAHHFFAAAPAGYVREAVDYARRAGERAVRLLAFEEGVALYRLGLQLTDDGIERCELLLALGDAEARAGDTPTAKVAFREAAQLATSHGLPEHLARAALGYGGRLLWDVSRDDPQLAPLLEKALTALGEEDSTLRVMLLARIAGGPLRDATADVARRHSLGAQALAMARRIGDPATLAYALHGYIASRHSPSFTPEQAEIAGELVQVALEVRDLERAVEGYETRLQTAIELGDMATASADLQAMTALADELRQPAQRWIVSVHRGLFALLEGRLDEAERLIAQTRVLGERAQGWNAAVTHGLQLYALRREQRRVQEVEELVRAAAGEYRTYPIWRCVLVNTLAELGLCDEARAELAAVASDGFAALPFDEEWEVSMCFLAEAASRLGDVRTADAIYERLRPYAGRVAISYPEISIGPISRFLGVAAATASRWDDAELRFREAIELGTRMGARASVAHAKRGCAEVLLEREDPRPDEARTLLLEAASTYAALGMQAYAGDVANRLDRLTTSGGVWPTR